MKTVEKSVLIWYSPAQMFDLVTKVELYPEFLPWCAYTRILEQMPDGMVAEVGMSIAAFKQSFTTRNVHEANAAVHMSLVKGPFSSLEGHWRFTSVGNGAACKVEFRLQYGYDKSALSAILTPVFDKVAATMVDAFVKRAEQVYGE
ncbi:type II toxin-antitoxin system RatA family toxin [Curvibacter sp. CHRR-16]|uniref:type II toxin-antitoxin system RatA family toxin n=1 Tax=Curvibacter sp. CHRR-16 TaxID=2835872 RepID=UPI001BD9F62E|nr:type II toxin-antitoxin system RatA family toxin [Curvibacter sp. CHRR-16]MBT0570631.1 type II toxin-antitoxin system RatA family toxin [Curvibacter sp. CHRR-16]